MRVFLPFANTHEKEHGIYEREAFKFQADRSGLIENWVTALVLLLATPRQGISLSAGPRLWGRRFGHNAKADVHDAPGLPLRMSHPLGKPLLLSLSGHPLGQAVLLLLFTTAALPLSCTVYWFFGGTSSVNRYSGLINKRLRPKKASVWLNLARFINRSGNSRTIENMHLSPTFDGFRMS